MVDANSRNRKNGDDVLRPKACDPCEVVILGWHSTLQSFRESSLSCQSQRMMKKQAAEAIASLLAFAL